MLMARTQTFKSPFHVSSNPFPHTASRYEQWNDDWRTLMKAPKESDVGGHDGRRIVKLPEGEVPHTLKFEETFTAFTPKTLELFGETADGPNEEPNEK